MGGKAGHMKHLYENPELTFGEIKQIFKKINDGKMLVTEKIDGQNCLVSYSVTEGRIKAARNNSHLAKGGLPIENISELTDVADFQQSLAEALSSFEETVKKLSIEEQIDIFGPNTNYYYNTEIQDPNNKNILLYENKRICIHRSGHLLNNKYNNIITEEILSDQFRKLEETINKQTVINETVTDKFIVSINPIRKLEPVKNKNCYTEAVNKLNKEILTNKLTDSSSLAEYILSRMDSILEEKIPELPKEAKIVLLKRLMKVKEITAKNVYKILTETNNSHLIEKVKNIIDSENKLHKACINPVEEIVTEYGAGVLSEFVSSNIKDTISESNRIKTRLKEIFDIVNMSNDLAAKEFVNKQLSRMKNLDKVNITCEGIVFKFNGDVYKMTGFFSPLNQILGMTKFARGNIQPINIVAETVANKTAVLSWGRFNPPTIGHEIVFKTASDLAESNNADFFIIPSKTVDKKTNPLTFEEKVKYLNKLFPEYKSNVVTDESIKTIFEAAKYFHQNGYTNLKIVVGSDRKEQFEVLKKYNNKEYVFENIEILSAGERLDEGESAASMSASKMREAATQGDIGFFMRGVAGRLELQEGVELMNLIRSRLEATGEDGKKKVLEPISPSSLNEVIRKSGSKWCLFSKKKTKDGKRKKLGCYPTRAGAVKREKQVQYFKHMKEEQEIEEMSAASGTGGIHGAAFVDKQEETINVFNQSLTSRFGSSPKRDDDNVAKEKIKILFREEEQYMVDRKEFLEEIQLRKIIREGIKKKIKEREESVLKEEQQLRLVIRKLLNEKQKDEPRHANTGINLLKDLLKTIVPSIEDDYKDLTTNPEQVKSFRAHLLNGAINIFKSADGLQDQPEAGAEEITEQEVVDPNQPTDPRFIPIKKPQVVKKEPVDTFTIQGLDRTGANVAKTTFRKIENKIKNTYENLTDPKDREMFKDYLITNLKLHMDIFDNDMQGNMKEPTTPEYEEEKGKLDTQQDTTAPEMTGSTEEPPPQM